MKGVKATGGQRARRLASLRDHVLKQEYEDICEKYVVATQEIGSGQFGSIRKCIDRSTGKQYACKTIQKFVIRVAKDADDLRHEVHCLNMLRGHPSVIALQHSAEDDKKIHLVMELCKGGDLFDRIKQHGPIPEPNAAKIMKSLTSAIMACHAQGIIHRDIKPENVLLCDPDPDCCRVKLIDFGISVSYRPGSICDDLMGTPFYMAPEVYGRRYGPECDLWSLGVLLYVILSGLPPFWAKKGRDVEHDVVHGRPSFNHPKWEGISAVCKDLILQLLHRDPTSRITGPGVLGHDWIQLLAP